MRSILILSLVFSLSAFAAPKKTYSVNKERSYHALGLKRTDHSKNFLNAKKLAKKAVLAPVGIPGAADLTPLVSPPENQGQCGSCWAFGITKALRSALMLVKTDPGTLAFNYLVNNCGPGPAQSGCGGGDFDAGESMLNGAGPWLESQDPYTGQQGQCPSGLSTAGTALTYETVGSGNSAPSFQDLAQAISQDHMLVVDVAVCGDWESYSEGIFNENQCGANSINHIINMVGYNCETSIDKNGNCAFDSNGQPINGDGYLKAMNNWGTSWGEDGYMRTRWGMDAIANTAMYFTVKSPPAPIPTPGPTPSPNPSPINLPLYIGVALAGLLALAGVIVGLRKK